MYINQNKFALAASLAPVPAYALYLSPTFVDDEANVAAEIDKMVAVADIKTFDNFIIDAPMVIDVNHYPSAVVWCVAFSEFITAAGFQQATLPFKAILAPSLMVFVQADCRQMKGFCMDRACASRCDCKAAR